MMFRVSRGLVMTTIDTVRCQPLWNQLFCQRVFVAGPPSPAWQNERNSNWTPISELRTDIGAEQARDELICGDAFVWSLVIRSVVTRCGDWPIRGQHSDTWPIRRGDNDHIWQPASTIGSKKVLNPFWAIIPLLSAGHIHYHWPHLRPPHYRREQWIMFSVISPPCLCSGNVFICENWELLRSW